MFFSSFNSQSEKFLMMDNGGRGWGIYGGCWNIFERGSAEKNNSPMRVLYLASVGDVAVHSQRKHFTAGVALSGSG